ncbi:hypothetical protein [Parasutterella sp.]|uniref:hypothetical protein n=1 Tax=Parasutterella sp. TaxID=2049037 RepID=UPI003AF0C865
MFVKKMALFQIAPELKPTDKRVTGIRTAIESMPDNFKHLFIKEYNECFNLGFKNIPSPEIQEFGVQTQEGDELPSSPIEAPSKALRSQEQEQEQEQETYTRTENNEKQSELAENFAGRECEKPVSLKTEAIEEELPLEEREASVSKKEIVESKPKKEVKTQRLQKPEELTDEFWQDFFTYRKQKKAPVTERVISLLRKEAKKAGWTLEEVINEMMVRNWTGFKADWVKDDWKDPNAHWVSAAEYNKELPPVTYSTGAKTKFVERLHAGMRAYDIKDLPNNKEQR